MSAAAVRSVLAARAATSAAVASSTSVARAVPTAPLVVLPSAPPSATSMVPQSMDGLPLLPSHVESWGVDAAAATPLSSAGVSLHGEVSTRDDVRHALVGFYRSTGQLAASSGGAAPALTEMTLRMDVELEMLRRQCFAERNARWGFHTPDEFSFVVAAPPTASTSAFIPARKQRLQVAATADSDTLPADDAGVAVFVRDRPWPPKEFALKPSTKPSRYSSSGGSGSGSSHKKKVVGMSGVVIDLPTAALVCAECQTQRSALWRKRPRRRRDDATAVSLTAATAAVAASTPAQEAALQDSSQAINVASGEDDDVCLQCYYKTERRDVFDKVKAEKARKAKEAAARAAAEARQLKKLQQQLKKKLKRLTSSSSIAAADSEDSTEPMDSTSTASLSHGHSDVKREEGSTNGDVLASEQYSENGELSHSSRKEKRSKKDKKKKKKKKKKSSSSRRDWDDSDSDEDDAASSVIMPSPPQRQMDGFVYADRSVELKDEPPIAESIVEQDIMRLKIEPQDVAGTPEAPRSSKRAAASTSTPKRASSSTSSSSSKKRKSSDAVSTAAPSTASSTSRPSRSRATTGPTAETTPVVAAAPSTPASRKRVRPTKKESARERELRAKGQYCPVCNVVYEEDDPSPFVCCDSCEMWVHAACDTSLSADALAALSESNEKYICPLCSGR
ncbi:hypothetical protein P43SY_002787 [Pythium insidiosum]|uniref:PHD-type domain-containing protein n=1 Tax=Pythium insidiosum TaxID=114742 RepID=A0AAD5QFQ4_PYTIN|nr:hypothetical protein P43SY_002787 [Pythium insidiosum]